MMNFVNIKTTLTTLTGLHIGGNDDTMSIGGIDNPVILDKNNLPYIPASSIKGKMRFLLEHLFGLVRYEDGGKVINSDIDFKDEEKNHFRDLIVDVFGEATDSKRDNKKNDNEIAKIKVPRAIFRDAKLKEKKDNLLEIKTENTIDRISGTSKDGLRDMQRVVDGTVFDINISIRCFANDDIEKYTNLIILGLRVLELDTLGGSGTRGYGQVEFGDIEYSTLLDDKLKGDKPKVSDFEDKKVQINELYEKLK